MNKKMMKNKKKLCWNCEGSVSVHVEHCPYCGVYLSPDSAEEHEPNALFAPPYRLTEPTAQQEAPVSPYASFQAQTEPVMEEEISTSSGSSAASQPNGSYSIWALALLLSGAYCLIFSLALVLFSSGGVFTLSWETEYWYLYTAVSSVLLYAGWYAFKRIPDVTS